MKGRARTAPRTARGLRRVAASLTIATILGTLAGCGVYGRPKRPVAEPEASAPIGSAGTPRAKAG